MTESRKGFEAQRKAGMNVDWFTWQIAWHDALFTMQDNAAPISDAPAPIARIHVTQADDGLEAEVEVLDGTLLQPSMSPVNVYAAPIGDLQPTASPFPDELTPALREVLGWPNFRCGPVAHVMRAAGADIKRKAEDEQAVVLHWFVKLVLAHGDQWWSIAADQLCAMQDTAASPESQGDAA